MPHLKITAGAVCMGCLWFCLDPLGLFLPFLLSAATHELGHVLLLRIKKIPIYAVRVTALGCVLETGVMDYSAERWCAAAGPVVNLLLFALLLPNHTAAALVNLVLAIFNLLPLWPLDGGRFLRATLYDILPLPGAQKAERVAITISSAGLWALAAYATCRLHMGLWPVLLAAILMVKAGNALREEKFVAKKRVCRYNKTTS